MEQSMLDAWGREPSPGSLIYWLGLAGSCISIKASEAVCLNAHQQHCSQTPNNQYYTRTRLPFSTFKCLMRATWIALNAINKASIKQLEQLTLIIVRPKPEQRVLPSLGEFYNLPEVGDSSFASKLHQAVEGHSKERSEKWRQHFPVFFQDH